MGDTERRRRSTSTPRRGRWPTRRCAFETVQGIARLTLNRPPANVLSIEMMDEINAALESLEYQRDVKLVVLSAAGKYFSPGLRAGRPPGRPRLPHAGGVPAIFENLAKIDKPTLAVVAGPALGAGSILAAGCDIVLAAASAKFGHPEIKGGVFNPVAAALLPRLVGRKKAFEMILRRREPDRRRGRAHRPDHARGPGRAAGRGGGGAHPALPGGHGAPVLQMRAAGHERRPRPALPDAVRHAEDVYLNQLMATEDAEEGLKAVMAKRKPVWKDR